MKTLALLATVAAAGLSLAACAKSDDATNAATATDAFANDIDTGNEILTDENAFAAENQSGPQDNLADNALSINATTANAL